MKTIELTDKEYADLLAFKNFVSLKTRQVTNKDAMGKRKDGTEYLKWQLRKKMDFEPEYRLGECLSIAIGSIMDEQKTGEVNYIT